MAQEPRYRGKGVTSLIFSTPSSTCINLSKPSPNPPCGTEPKRLVSRYLETSQMNSRWTLYEVKDSIGALCMLTIGSPLVSLICKKERALNTLLIYTIHTEAGKEKRGWGLGEREGCCSLLQSSGQDMQSLLPQSASCQLTNNRNKQVQRRHLHIYAWLCLNQYVT